VRAAESSAKRHGTSATPDYSIVKNADRLAPLGASPALRDTGMLIWYSPAGTRTICVLETVCPASMPSGPRKRELGQRSPEDSRLKTPAMFRWTFPATADPQRGTKSVRGPELLTRKEIRASPSESRVNVVVVVLTEMAPSGAVGAAHPTTVVVAKTSAARQQIRRYMGPSIQYGPGRASR